MSNLNQLQGFARGLRICTKMLGEMEDVDQYTVEPEARVGPQDNAVKRALDKILARGDAAELEGFCAALTELCAFADESMDYTRGFTKIATKRERMLKRAATEIASRADA